MKEKLTAHCRSDKKRATLLFFWGIMEFTVSLGLFSTANSPFVNGVAAALGPIGLLHIYVGWNTYRSFWKMLKGAAQNIDETNLLAFLREESNRIRRYRYWETSLLIFFLLLMLLSVLLNLSNSWIGTSVAGCIGFSSSLIWWLVRQWHLGVLLGDDF